MKKKALVVVILCVMGLAALFSGNAEAAPPWYTCNISLCGANSWGYLVTLTDTGGAFSNQTFVIDPNSTNGKVCVAAALTAFSTDNNVMVFLNSTTAYSLVDALFAVK